MKERLIKKYKKGKRWFGVFICHCGNEVECRLDQIKKDCGCSKKSDIPPARENPFYNTWRSMKKSCYSKNDSRYLGGDIKVCEEWLEFKNFYYWAVENHSAGLMLTRLDLNKDYSPSNCKFVTRKELDSMHNLVNKRKEGIDRVKNEIGEEIYNFKIREGIEKTISEIGREEYKRRISEKVKETSLKKYGVEHYLQSDEIKEKRRQTNLEKYGVEVVSQAPEIIEKIKQTNIDRYGVPCIFQTEEHKQKVIESNREKYGYDYRSQHPDLKDEIVAKMLSGTTNTTSKEELELKTWLEKSGYKFEKNSNDILHLKEIDLYCEELKLGIEYCGLYFHTSRTKPKDYHYQKYIDCQNKGVRLITIFSDEWKKRRPQVENRLLSILGKTKRLYARKCEVRKIDNRAAKEFINKFHIQSLEKSPTHAFGLFHEEKLVSVMSFARHPRDSSKIALNRFCSYYGTSVVGGASKLLKYAKQYILSPIYSWSDNRWSDGGVYEKLGFELIKELPPDYSYVIENDRVSKQKCKKSLIGCPEHITEKDFMEELGYYRIYDCGKKTFLV